MLEPSRLPRMRHRVSFTACRKKRSIAVPSTKSPDWRRSPIASSSKFAATTAQAWRFENIAERNRTRCCGKIRNDQLRADNVLKEQFILSKSEIIVKVTIDIKFLSNRMRP